MNMTMIYKILSISGFVLACIFLMISILLFYKWKIPKIFNDITGRSEKKRIAEIKERGIASVASDQYKANVKKIYQTRGKTTNNLRNNKSLSSGLSSRFGKTGKNVEITKPQNVNQEVLVKVTGEQVISETEEKYTGMLFTEENLEEKKAVIAQQSVAATQILMEENQKTIMLNSDAMQKKYRVVYSFESTGTDKVIQKNSEM